MLILHSSRTAVVVKTAATTAYDGSNTEQWWLHSSGTRATAISTVSAPQVPDQKGQRFDAPCLQWTVKTDLDCTLLPRC